MNISAQNTFTEPVLIQGGETFDVSISGTFGATVWLQRWKEGMAGGWLDVESFTAPAEKTGVSGSAWFYRLGVKTGDYISGTVVAEIWA